MRFQVSEIRSAGSVERTATLDPQGILGQPPPFVFFQHPLNVVATASLTSSDILVSGHVATTIGFVCARCLENFERRIEVDFKQVFGADLKELDVVSDIREAVYIDLPLTPVCQENCRGLCPSCGKNRNLILCECKTSPTNSQWDALKQFKP